MSSAKNHKARSRYHYKDIPFAAFRRTAYKRDFDRSMRHKGLLDRLFGIFGK